ncbi:MAG: SDR family oxidoreductase [Chloroflexi bacterium]|nr:SDR family oxidoreductase [Chloroflexota bacterium]
MRVQELLDLSGRVAIVTGGGTHLGKAMASTLGELGAAVFLASRRGELCEQAANELRAAGIDATGLKCDVTSEPDVQALVGRVVIERGRLDVMIANAGGSFTSTYIPRASIDEFRKTLELNLTGTYVCAQAAAEVMMPRRSGKIITLGSIHGFLAADKRFYKGLNFRRSGPPYQAAKGGVINLTRALAAELGEWNIQVNCISPGQIPRADTDPAMVEKARLNNPLEVVGRPEHLKGAVALLASPAGDWITGQNIVVDGGWSIW